MRLERIGQRVRAVPHWMRVVLLMIAVTALLTWLAGHTRIIFADGLRYIDQARRIDRGDWSSGIREAVDHPAYPLAIVVAHRLRGGGPGPLDWQAAAQSASVFAGILLVIPLYLASRELFGGKSAWAACVFAYLAPVTGHVFADGLSEAWFLMLWTWGVWTSLRFLREGGLGWLMGSVVFGSLAYLCRPEGVLLPVALMATLVVSVLVPKARLSRRRWWSAFLFLVVGGLSLVGPYVALKGGVGTKPAVARLLGLAPPSASGAVEREHPLPANQKPIKTYALAVRAAAEAVRDAVPWPLLILGLAGFFFRTRRSANLRPSIFLGIVFGGWWLALIRLHATGGYCSPRHALILSLFLSAAAAAGLRGLAALLLMNRRIITSRLVRTVQGAIGSVPILFMLGFAAWNAGPLLAPVNAGTSGYREAGEWLARNSGAGERVVDVTGWSQFYGDRPGYTFRNLVEAPSDPSVRWVVVREAHLNGPWPYCARLRALVEGSRRVARFPRDRAAGQSRISVFERPRNDLVRQTASEERTPPR